MFILLKKIYIDSVHFLCLTSMWP